MEIINNSSFRLICFWSLILFLSSCNSSWQHSTKNEDTYYSEKNACLAEANKVYPPLISTPSNYGNNSDTTCTSNEDGTLNCETRDKPSYYDESSYDINTNQRGSYAKDCLRSRGWRLLPNQ